jgi:hypothetical protein
MREDLAQLYEAGISRIKFTAYIQLWSRRGLIALENVESPTGVSSHVWVREASWRGRAPKAGFNVEFMATIYPYYKGQGDLEYGLCNCDVIRMYKP